MKESFIILILSLVTLTCLGQGGTIYINGQKFETSGAKVSYFKFDLFDTVLTKETIEYLNEFGNYCKENLNGEQRYLIELAPSLTNVEKEANEDFGRQRLMIVLNYLEKTFGMTEFRARLSETLTITCHAYLAGDRDRRKLKRKEKH